MLVIKGEYNMLHTLLVSGFVTVGFISTLVIAKLMINFCVEHGFNA